MWEYVGEAAMFSGIASSGFQVAVLTAWVIMRVSMKNKKKRKGPLSSSSSQNGSGSGFGYRQPGKYSKMLLILELLDSLPEGMIIASATTNNRMTFAFAISIFLLNVINTLASSLDYIATRPEKNLHRVLFILLFFSVGALFFSVSDIVFEGFLTQVHAHDANYLLLVSIFSGLVLGVVLIAGIIAIQTHLEEKAKTQRGDSLISGQDGEMQDISKTLGHMRVLLKKEEDNVKLISQGQGQEYDEQQKRAIEYYERRADKIRNIIKSLEAADGLKRDLNLTVTEDASNVIADTLTERVMMDFNVSSEDELEGEGVLSIENASACQLFINDPINKRTLILLGFVTALALWSVILATSLTPLFYYLDEIFPSGHLNAFADGLSGGAFLSVISSTMIPRIQQDAYRSQWSPLVFRITGMIAFVCGITMSFFLEFIG